MERLIKLIAKGYRQYSPLWIRKKLVSKKAELATHTLKEEILNYYNSLAKVEDVEIRDILDYLKNNPCRIFNADFVHEYIYRENKIYYDKIKGFPYVLHQGKKMYFRKDMSSEKINAYYNSLSVEQDKRSPHHYFLEEEKELLNLRTIIDIGGAEGIFSLNLVEHVEKIYIFECEEEWLEPLSLTFEPWKEKVHIINKYVSDICKGNQISLDEMFGNRNDIDVIKMDVEGAEIQVLRGANAVLEQNQGCLVFACAYHYQQEEKELEQWANENGWQCKGNKGYMIFLYDETPQSPPYFRRGVVRLRKL